MAASYQRTLPNTPLHNRTSHYQDTIEIKLPSGSCNFRNLDPGGNAATCGCKRFWGQASDSLKWSGESRSGFCFCEHHACYHDEFPESPRKSFIESAIEDPQLVTKHISIPPRPVYVEQGPTGVGTQDSERHQSTVPDTLQFSRYIEDGSPVRLGLPAIPSQCLLPSDNGSMTSGSQDRYTRPFGGLGLGTLSHIPTSGSAKPGNVAPTKLSQLHERKMQIYRDGNGIEYLQSLTEGATPSVQTSQNPSEFEYGKITNLPVGLDKLVQKKSQGHSTVALRPVSKCSTSAAIKESASHPGVNLAEIPSDCDEDEEFWTPKVRNLVKQMSGFPNRMENHEHRLQLLENTSFTNPALDDLHDADDRMETRVGDIEDRILELERVHAAINDTSSVGSKQQLIEGSFGSRASVTSSAMIASSLDRVDPARIEALEAHIAELQAVALPSFFRPWQVEVVFLPYGPRLMGIWSTQHASTQRLKFDGSARRGCTPTQQSSSTAAQVQLVAHDQACAWERSTSDMGQEDLSWSMAKACGPGSRVTERLRSRGLVKTVQILGPEARDVQAAMIAAFGDLPALLKEDPFSVHQEDTGAVPNQLRAYQALQSPWVPLRKIHKDSCLRFLNPSEMATQALWTVPFLTSNVAMRQKDVKRLFVTQSDSYVQHLGDNTVDWTWQKLRRLPRVYPESQSQEGHTPEGDANEPCWNFDDRLDPVQDSYHSSFASHISSLSIHSPMLGDYQPRSQSDHFSSAPNSPNDSSTSTSVATNFIFPSSPVRERHPFRALSMSAAAPINPPQPVKRRITSFDQETHTHSRTPSTATNSNYILPKRRRISRSPSRPRDTPRYSEGPTSPYYMDDVAGKQNDRLTPFAYATPHSNAPYIDHAQARGAISIHEDVDDQDSNVYDDQGSLTNDDMDADNDNAEANALSDSDGAVEYDEQERQINEEWEGLEDDDLRGRAVYESLEGERDEDDAVSETSSASPSEYPSKQQGSDMFPEPNNLGYGVVKGTFRIHVDEEV